MPRSSDRHRRFANRRRVVWQDLRTDLHCDRSQHKIRASRNEVCEAEMKTTTTLLLCLLAAPASQVTAQEFIPPIKTTFDCSTAKATIEKLVCRDPQLLQMDMEVLRLYRLALTDEHSDPRPDKVLKDQQSWSVIRNLCGAEAQPKACVIARYAERAYQLRQGSAIVRTKDPDRLTEGPQALRCTGVNTPISATFFNTRPGAVYLKWASTSITLNQVPSDVGTRYTGKDKQGDYSFWQNGEILQLQKPGSGVVSCTTE